MVKNPEKLNKSVQDAALKSLNAKVLYWRSLTSENPYEESVLEHRCFTLLNCKYYEQCNIKMLSDTYASGRINIKSFFYLACVSTNAEAERNADMQVISLGCDVLEWK